MCLCFREKEYFICHGLKSVDTALRAQSGGTTGGHIFTNVHINLWQVCDVSPNTRP